MRINSTRGSTFRDRRLELRRTLRDVAVTADIDAGHLSKVERGEKGLSVESMFRLATALGLADLVKLLKPHIDRADRRQQPGDPR